MGLRNFGRKKSPDFSGLSLEIQAEKFFVDISSGIFFVPELSFIPVRECNGVAHGFDIV
jgi:hypothetical protein